MNRSELEHILRACKEITGEVDFIIVGSQSILGKHPDAPRALRRSMELDIYPRHRPDLADEIEGSLGALSLFDQTFGYHADGVGPETAMLPPGWEERLIPVTNAATRGATGWCLDPYDLAYAKLAAGRRKDLEFVANLLRFRMVGPTRLRRFLEKSTDPTLKAMLLQRLMVCGRMAREEST
jgi:hypothetical protein